MVGGDGVPHSAKNKTLRRRCGRNGRFEAQKLFGGLPAPLSNFFRIPTVGTERIVLPMVAAARERDRIARLHLGLELIDWEGS